MFRTFFEDLKVELSGIIPEVRIGIPKEDKDDTRELDDTTVYLSFINIENIDRQRDIAIIRVLITVFVPKVEDLEEEETNELAAVEAIDEIFRYLENDRRSYNLIATSENLMNNIWSALRIPLRPFLIYECPINLSTK